MPRFLDLHTHTVKQSEEVTAIQSLSITQDIFLAMPKTRPISIGIHPWYGNLPELQTHMKYLKVLSKQQNVKLIGECGLDKLRGAPLNEQTEILTKQIQLAVQLDKPIILHCVKAFDELIALKKQLNPSVPMIIHGFDKKPELALQLVHNGFLLSFGSGLIKRPSTALAFQQIGDVFFLETDNSSFSIEEIYQKAAELKKISIERLKDIIFANWKKLNLL
ncbi:TatD family hydrolase [Pedobacter montanisoli]|uniref:TatD family hydrolase n=1 Tax=Pedobacter montanisoli TaxID=2923277 RepID=A0ABS9ZUE1_9SPHI|nr:TatD family hydrolase [Pedobacter montanisoli]MCJ0741987.1 TatD family hydrolase [Pedobacter montanisoli]